jgi:hypothetical protein
MNALATGITEQTWRAMRTAWQLDWVLLDLQRRGAPALLCAKQLRHERIINVTVQVRAELVQSNISIASICSVGREYI